MSEVECFPVQVQQGYRQEPAKINKVVALRAYEVYCHVYSPQEALVTGQCRGGFSAGELIAFLYAHTFPAKEWRQRVDEAFEGMKL